MIANHLFAIWTNVDPALGNHLWQSTLCLVVAGLLARAWRKNPARLRYGVGGRRRLNSFFLGPLLIRQEGPTTGVLRPESGLRMTAYACT
jgi:hypothetical protein